MPGDGTDPTGRGGRPARPAPVFTPGAAGVGDPYFPLAGNGGYDVRMYLLDITYDPATDVLTGVATIVATATQNLSSFNLDLDGLTVRSITVNGRPATWTRSGAELTVRPAQGLPNRVGFAVVVRYDGVPRTLLGGLGPSGFLHTDDGTVVAGEPEVAALWFPVNDHPTDKALYTFRIKVPAGLEAIANGLLVDSRTFQGWTTWTWVARGADGPVPGHGDDRSVRRPRLHQRTESGTGTRSTPTSSRPGRPAPASSSPSPRRAQPSYKRLSRTITVPPGGAQLSFWIARDTEPDWDFAFVEAHTVGQDDWTTLPDAYGHTSQDVGQVCALLASASTRSSPTTRPTTVTAPARPRARRVPGHAASGPSGDYEKWTVDLSPYAGSSVEVAISYASDDLVQWSGVAVDDVVVSTGAGTTSFEADGDPFDGWVVPGAPAGQRAQPQRLDRHRSRCGAPDHQGHQRLAGPATRDHRVPRRAPSAGTRSGCGRDRGRHPRAPLRAGEPDPADLLEGVLHRLVQRRPRRRARTGPPVVRRQRRGRRLAADLAQRGLRNLRRMAVERA